MDKKKAGITIIIIIVLAIVLGICFMIFGGRDRRDKRDEAQNVATTEPSAERTTEAVIEPTTEPSEETEYENNTEAFESVRQSFDVIMAEDRKAAEDNFREEERTNIVTDAAERKNEILNEIADKEYLGVPENIQKVLRQYEQLLWVTINMDWDSALFCSGIKVNKSRRTFTCMHRNT